MRIGLDIDDTITNTHFILMKYAYKYNLENGNRDLLKYNTNNFSKAFGWSHEETNAFFQKYYLEALKEIEPKYHAKEVLNQLREEGHQIIFITVRNDLECGGEKEAYRLTKEWFEKYEIPYDEICVGINDKKSFCREHSIDAFMDDSEKNVLSVSELGIPTFIAMNSFNLDFQNPTIQNIYSMDQFYQELKKYS